MEPTALYQEEVDHVTAVLPQDEAHHVIRPYLEIEAREITLYDQEAVTATVDLVL